METKKKLGFYPGSFKPFHVGHWDVVKQAVAIFDRVIVAQGVNPEKTHVKQYPLPDFLYDVASPTTFDGLLIDAMARWETDYDVTLVRGLRTVIDLTEEQNYIAFLRGMKPDIKVAYFFCHPEVQHVSSSRLRGLEMLAPEEFAKYTHFPMEKMRDGKSLKEISWDEFLKQVAKETFASAREREKARRVGLTYQ
jgi:pantetheine-phosphate adenylyltransferase